MEETTGSTPELVSIPGLREALIALQDMPPERYTDYQWEVLDAILKLLPYAAAYLKVGSASAARSTSPRSRKARCVRWVPPRRPPTCCSRSTTA